MDFMTEKMKCEAPKCIYEFLENEEDYLCCPECGYTVFKNLSEEEQYKKIELEKINNFNIIKNKMNTFVGVYLAIHATLLFTYMLIVEDILLNFKSRYKVRYSRAFAIVLFVLFFCVIFSNYNIYRIKLLKKILGKNTWRIYTIEYTLIKWIILALLLYLMFRYLIPVIYSSYWLPMYIRAREIPQRLILEIKAGKMLGCFLFPVFIFVDIFETLKRNYCFNMIDKK